MSDDTRITFAATNSAKDVFREVDLRARTKMSANRELSYQQAVHLVFTDANAPDSEALHLAYLDSVPPLHHNRARS
jgi:hypothetical protein